VKDVVVLLSGGMDSAVLLGWVRNETDAAGVHALSVDYGQRHRRELWSAFQLARFYGAEFHRVGLPPSLLAGSALTGSGEVPRGLDYRDPGQAATVVAGRNLVLASLAVAHAARHGCDRVYLAAHAGDRAVYPDCRPEFVAGLDRAAREGYGVSVLAPFAAKGMDKRAVAHLGKSLGVPLDMTWSCYEGGDRPCGSCGACAERSEALA
jgi:7-cyano-7-deazaguanine synthase